MKRLLFLFLLITTPLFAQNPIEFNCNEITMKDSNTGKISKQESVKIIFRIDTYNKSIDMKVYNEKLNVYDITHMKFYEKIEVNHDKFQFYTEYKGNESIITLDMNKSEIYLDVKSNNINLNQLIFKYDTFQIMK